MPRLQRLFTLAHLIGFALFLGGTMGVTLLVAAGEFASDGMHRVFALSTALQLHNFLIRPGAAIALLSGALMSATGPWGFVKYRWMIGKLALTAVLAVHSQLSFHPRMHQLLSIAQQSPAGQMPSDYGELFNFFVRVAVIQVIVLVVLAGLGILKPGGRTRPSRRPATQASA